MRAIHGRSRGTPASPREGRLYGAPRVHAELVAQMQAPIINTLAKAINCPRKRGKFRLIPIVA